MQNIFEFCQTDRRQLVAVIGSEPPQYQFVQPFARDDEKQYFVHAVDTHASARLHLRQMKLLIDTLAGAIRKLVDWYPWNKNHDVKIYVRMILIFEFTDDAIWQKCIQQIWNDEDSRAMNVSVCIIDCVHFVCMNPE